MRVWVCACGYARVGTRTRTRAYGCARVGMHVWARVWARVCVCTYGYVRMGMRACGLGVGMRGCRATVRPHALSIAHALCSPLHFPTLHLLTLLAWVCGDRVAVAYRLGHHAKGHPVHQVPVGAHTALSRARPGEHPSSTELGGCVADRGEASGAVRVRPLDVRRCALRIIATRSVPWQWRAPVCARTFGTVQMSSVSAVGAEAREHTAGMGTVTRSATGTSLSASRMQM